MALATSTRSDIAADLSIATATATPTATAPSSPTVWSGPSPVTTIPDTLRDLTTTQNLIYPLEVPKYYMRFEVSNYSRSSLLKLGDLVPVGNIILPLPQQLADAHNVLYEQQAMSTLGGTAVQLGAQGVNPGSGRSTQSSTDDWNQLSAAQQLRRSGAGLAAAISTSVSNFTGVGQSLSVPIRAFSGLSPNHFLTILLQGPSYKRFEFVWRFSPKSEQESEVLRRIRRDLNNYMSPGLFGIGGALFTFPKIFQISLMPNSKYMYKFKPAVLESLMINYTPGGQAAFFKAKPGTDNLPAPEGIDMNLRFVELEFWLDGDFNDSNNPTDNTFKAPATTTPSTPPGSGAPTPVIPGDPSSGFNPGSQIP